LPFENKLLICKIFSFLLADRRCCLQGKVIFCQDLPPGYQSVVTKDQEACPSKMEIIIIAIKLASNERTFARIYWQVSRYFSQIEVDKKVIDAK